jgi:small-conductance mechanosensitive channel
MPWFVSRSLTDRAEAIMSLDTLFLQSALRQWVIALGVTVASYLVLHLARVVLVARFGAIAKRTTNKIDDVVVALIQRTHAIFLFVMAMHIGASFLDDGTPVNPVLWYLTVVAGVFQVGRWGSTVLAAMLQAQMRRIDDTDRAQLTTLHAVAFLLRTVLYVVLVLLALDNLGVNVTALVTGLGIGGVAVALAAQSVLGDLFASLSIVLDRPFVLGDFIVAGTEMGTVEHIGIKTTRLRSLSGEQLIFANSDLLKSRVQNYQRMKERRVIFTVGVSVDTPPELMAKAPGIVQTAVEGQQNVRFERSHFRGFGESSLDIEYVYWVLDADYNRYADIQQAINLQIMTGFASAGIAFATTTRVVKLERVQSTR